MGEIIQKIAVISLTASVGEKMKSSLASILFAALLGISTSSFQDGGSYPIHVDISVYYESYCPYSRRFIDEQLGPTFQTMGKYMKVDLNPAGNAEITDQFTIACQHGEKECEAGIMTACLLEKMDVGADTVPVVACIESMDTEPNDPNVTKQCMDSNGITNPLFDEVQRCANTQEGLGHFIFFIMRTQELNPPKEYVPWVLFNGVHNETMYNEAKEDLKGVLCNYFLDNLVPECQE